MFSANYNKINSAEACYALIRTLKQQVNALENRAKTLQQKRSNIPQDGREFLVLMKAVKAILLEPSYLENKSWLVNKYCEKYSLIPSNFTYCIKVEAKRRKNESSNQNRLTTLIMHSKGKRQVDISRATGLSKARVSQIISKHKKRLAERT